MILTRLRRRAAWGLWFEFFIRALGPGCFILLTYLTAALFGLGASWLFALVLLLALAAFAFGLWRLRRPRSEEIDRRIERASGLHHRPIAMLEDAPENTSEIADAIWRIEQRRITARMQSARAGWPLIGAARHDPLALRGLLLLLLLAGAIIAGPAGLPRLGSAFVLPGWPFAGPSVDAWVTQPGYAGIPPLLLAPGDQPAVLEGSQLTVIVNGRRSSPSAAYGGERIRFGGSADAGYRSDLVLSRSATLRIGPWWHRLAGWDFTVLAAAKPIVHMAQPLVRGQALHIGWNAQDPYGLVSLSVTLAPIGQPHAEPQLLSLPLEGVDSKNAGGVARPDIGDSPYAGLTVAVQLTARNLAAMSGVAGPMTVRLPPPDLQDRTAIALAALRQRLALDPATRQARGQELQKLAAAPPSNITAATDLQMAELGRRLATNETGAAAAQNRLGQLVRQAEEGPDYAPARALAAANARLEDALRQSIASGKPLDNARLQSLLAAMHAALAQHLQALGPGVAAGQAKTISENDLDRMAEQIAQDEAAGNTAKAAAELQQLERLLTAMQSARPMTAAQAKQAAAAGQAAQALAEMTQGESRLLDKTNQGNGEPGEQAALQKQLAATTQALQAAAIPLPGLDAAASAMDAARTALSEQKTGDATAAETGAIQALQKAATALAAARQGMSFGQGGSPASGDDGDGLDANPDEDSFPSALPSTDNAAGAIQRQIIENDNDPSLPAAVHRYYHRLLNQDSQ